jgi:hypothetical protein
MSEYERSTASEREEIQSRVASFKAMQQRFQHERDQYFARTMENARRSDSASYLFVHSLWS